MSERQWTSRQLAAMEARGSNVLVAAGAGSGKTAVLIERIIRRLADADDPFSIDQLLVVTFTNAAAEEMRERLNQALGSLAREEQASPGILRQLALLPQASITTLHSFCLDLVRRYFYHLGLDGNPRIAKDAELLILEEEVLERYLDEEYEKENTVLPLLADAYGGSRDDQGLCQLIQDLYSYSRSQPQPELWLEEAAGAFGYEDLEDYPWSGFLKEELRREIRQCRELLEKAAQYDVPGPWQELAEEEVALLNPLIEKEQPLKALLQKMAAVDFANLPRVTGGDKEEKQAFKKLREEAKKSYAALKKYFCIRPPEVLAEDLQSLHPLMDGLCRLVKGYAQALSREKQRRGLIDFGDMEHFCLALLEDESLGLAEELKDQYREILVDEYQDINGVQERILNLVSGGDNLFAVGDIKQSIYRFRLAEPTLFLDKYEQYARQEGGRRIDLNSNFRSSRQIIAGVNYLFGKILTAEAGEISYDEDAALYAGLPHEGQATEVLLLDKKSLDPESPFTLWQEECRLLAQRISELHQEGYALKDMAVLMRSPRNKQLDLVEELRRRGIAAVTAGGGNALETPEIGLILSLLRIIDNPRQDIPLAAALMAPGMDFKPDELIRLRLEHIGCLYEALQAEGEKGGHARVFLDQLAEWRRESRSLRVSQLIWKIYRDTGLYYLIGALPGGKLRQGNLMLLYRQALEYEESGHYGLFRFLRYMEELENRAYRAAGSRLDGAGADALSIMSIHGSKGLEFPVVFLAGLGTRFEMRDLHKDLLIHKDFGWGPKIARREARLKFPTLAYEAIGRRLRKEAVAEEIRILYVAMTRARERLILSGGVRDLEKSISRWAESLEYAGPLPAAQILGDATPLDWLGRALLSHPDGSVLRRFGGLEQQPPPCQGESRFEISVGQAICEEPPLPAQELDQSLGLIAEGQPLPPSPAGEEIQNILDYQYPYLEHCDFAAKWTVSRALEILSPQETEERAFADALPGFEEPPVFEATPIKGVAKTLPPLQRRSRDEAAARGSAWHLLLELADIPRAALAGDMQSQAEELIAAGRFPARWGDEELIQAAAGFFRSSLGQRLAKAEEIERERNFTYRLPASRLHGDLPEEEIMLQGMIDLAFAEKDGWVLVDYKSGGLHMSDAALLHRYAPQLKLYALALEGIWQKPVKEAYVYMLEDGRMLPVDLKRE